MMLASFLCFNKTNHIISSLSAGHYMVMFFMESLGRGGRGSTDMPRTGELVADKAPTG